MRSRETAGDSASSTTCLETKIVGRNYVARCPSCALAGRDRGRDNLAILVSDPRFYQCWAGCTKEMIRAAVGKPIPIRSTA